MDTPKKLNPALIFIFGGSGDLNFRKLTPALYNLFIDGLMPEKFTIVGIARSEYPGDAYVKHLQEGIHNFSRRKDDDKWNDFSAHINYLQLDVADVKGYDQVVKLVDDKKKEFGVQPVIIF